jgi:hypothetical protein
MADSALYFPYINVPERPSLTRVLLYWDTLGSIIPEGAELDSWTQGLVDAELVTPVRPSEYIDSSTLLSDLERLLDAGLARRRTSVPPFYLHIEKTNRWALEMLRERGLATWSSGQTDGRQPGWIRVDGEVGALYVAYLACYICQMSGLMMEPITDQALILETVSGVDSVATAMSLDHLRGAVLQGVLPSPRDGVTTAELVEFKRTHGALLKDLRTEVENHVLECAREPDPELRRRMCAQYPRRLSERAEEAERRMHERRWSTKRAVIALIAGSAAAAGPIASGEPGVALAAGAAPALIDWLQARFRPVTHDRVAVYAVLARDRFSQDEPSAAN